MIKNCINLVAMMAVANAIKIYKIEDPKQLSQTEAEAKWGTSIAEFEQMN